MTWLPRLGMVLLVAASAATAADDEYSRPSLKGLKGVGVVVEDLQAETEQGGLNKTPIQTDAELKLRQAGITVLTEAEVHAALGHPHLYINVSAHSEPPLYVFSIYLELHQDVRLDRDSSVQIFAATTWSVTGFGTVGRNNIRNIRDSIKDYVDRFINAYLSVNPKK